MTIRPILAAPALALSLSVLLGACGLTDSHDDTETSGTAPLTVTASDTGCEVSADEADSGTIAFEVTNAGTEVTEFYLYADDGLRIVGEVENIAPGLTRELVVSAEPGRYVTACKPGLTGKGIRSDFTVTDSGRSTTVRGVDQAAIDRATSAYAAYVRDQAAQLLSATTEFVAAYRAGEHEKARALYPTARQHWERIETVAESFGDLDPKMDLREADLEEGQEWTGWHRLEKDLWPPADGYAGLSKAARARYGKDLLANTRTLEERVQDMTFDVSQIGNGSKGLLDEVATGKITGEEDIWSHTDLYDFQANVDGARVAYDGLRPLLEVKDADLSARIGARFEALQALLDGHRDGDGFVSYDTVTEPERKVLSDAVNALSEPLSTMTGVLTR